MKTTKLTWALALAVVSLGCAGSLRPPQRPEDAVVDPALVGTWQSIDPDTGKETNEVWTVEQSGASSLRLTISTPGNDLAKVYNLQLFRLDGQLFVIGQFRQLRHKDETVQPGDLGAVPVSEFGRISIEGNTVRVGFLNYDWLKKALAEKKVQLAYEGDEDESFILLTAPPEQVRAFALRYARDAEVFPLKSIFQAPQQPRRSVEAGTTLTKRRRMGVTSGERLCCWGGVGGATERGAQRAALVLGRLVASQGRKIARGLLLDRPPWRNCSALEPSWPAHASRHGRSPTARRRHAVA